MARSTKKHNTRLGVMAIAAGFILAASVALWASYQTKSVSDHSKEKVGEIILEQLKEVKTIPSDSLASFLEELNDRGGCTDNTPAKHELRIEYQDYAKIKYGCGATDATMFLHKVDGEWQTISPTNQFHAELPLCSHVKEHNIPYVLYGEGCFKPNDSMSSPVVGTVMVSPEY